MEYRCITKVQTECLDFCYHVTKGCDDLPKLAITVFKFIKANFVAMPATSTVWLVDLWDPKRLNISSNGSTAARLSTVSHFFYLDPIIFADRKKQPIGASQSAIQVLGPNNTQGQINITIENTSLSCPPASHPIFSAFSASIYYWHIYIQQGLTWPYRHTEIYRLHTNFCSLLKAGTIYYKASSAQH